MNKLTLIIGIIIEVIIGAVLLMISLNLFLLYSYTAVLLFIFATSDYLRKLIRVYQIGNEIKIIAIQRKLGVSDEDIKKIYEETKGGTPIDGWESLEKDFRDVLNN